MTKAIYLAGPMSGLEELNFPAFRCAAAMLRASGNFVFDPSEASMPRSDQPYYRACMAVNMAWICAHAEAIALLPGWENSKGAIAEKALADALRLPVFYL